MTLPLLPDVGLIEEEEDLPEQQDFTRPEFLRAVYGDDFPDGQEQAPGPDDRDAAWLRWVEGRWESMRPGMRRILHIAARNRLMRKGYQWISSVGFGAWKEPPRARDEIRVVHNMLAPALDLHAQYRTEARPGFKTRPTKREQNFLVRAEAQQMALEYQWDQQSMPERAQELGYWVGTDGSCFLELFWDPDRGPEDEAAIGEPAGEVSGDVVRIDQISVSPDATPLEEPLWTIIRRTIPKTRAIAMYGPLAGENSDPGRKDEYLSSSAFLRNGLEVPGEEELHEQQETVAEYTAYLKRTPQLPDGMTVKIVGGKVVYNGPLFYGVVPVVRYTDGSKDPSYFPVPRMNDWIDYQMRVNKVLSLWVKSIRMNEGGRFIAKSGVFKRDTMKVGNATIFELNGGLQQGEALQTIPAFSLAPDAKELLDRSIQAFEQISGWNDQTRGSFSSDQSGRSILAQREPLEKYFMPGISSFAQSHTRWARLTLEIMRFGYDEPRTIALAGNGRPDLGRALTENDLDGICDVVIEPESMMPMPKAYRQFILDDLYAKQLISPLSYLQRHPYGFLNNIESPDLDHHARAMRVVQALIDGQDPPPVRWQDNPAVMQDALQKHIILADKYDEQIVSRAHERWMLMFQLQQQQQGAMPPDPMFFPQPGGNTQGAGTTATPSGLPPDQQPMLGSDPSVSAAPAMEFAMKSDADLAAERFDRSGF